MFGRKGWTKGTATLVSYQVVTTTSRNQGTVRALIRAQVVAQAEGIEPTSTEFSASVSHQRLPLAPGYVFDVQINRSDPTKVKYIENTQRVVEEIRAKRAAGAEAGRAQADQLAAEMQNEASSQPARDSTLPPASGPPPADQAT
jgi:hypothetical protein